MPCPVGPALERMSWASIRHWSCGSGCSRNLGQIGLALVSSKLPFVGKRRYRSEADGGVACFFGRIYAFSPFLLCDLLCGFLRAATAAIG